MVISPKIGWGLGAAGVVVLGVLCYFFFHASDPAAQAPIPYKKVDYKAYMQREQKSDRQPPAAGLGTHP